MQGLKFCRFDNPPIAAVDHIAENERQRSPVEDTFFQPFPLLGGIYAEVCGQLNVKRDGLSIGACQLGQGRASGALVGRVSGRHILHHVLDGLDMTIKHGKADVSEATNDHG